MKTQTKDIKKRIERLEYNENLLRICLGSCALVIILTITGVILFL